MAVFPQLNLSDVLPIRPAIASHQFGLQTCCCEDCGQRPVGDHRGLGYYSSRPARLRAWNGLETYTRAWKQFTIQPSLSQNFPILENSQEKAPPAFAKPPAAKLPSTLADATSSPSNRPTLQSALRFTNATETSGINVLGESWGAAWGDANRDGRPDVYVTRHLTPSNLYINLGNGRFQDQTERFFGRLPKGDKHGAAWADYNNDGYQDLLQLTGGPQQTQLYRNTQGRQLTNIASQLGISYTASGRMPLWVDDNRDGRLDIIINARSRDNVPPTLFQQTNQGFRDVGQAIGYTTDPRLTKFFTLLTDIGNSEALDLLTKQESSVNGQVAQDITRSPYRPIQLPRSLADATAVADIVSADFDGDLKNDLFLARGGGQGDAFQPNANRLNLFLNAARDEKSVQFNVTGAISLELPTVPANQIFIGAQRNNPSQSRFILAPNDPAVQGRPPHRPGVDRGVYVSYDRTTQTWTISWSNPRASEGIYGFVQANNAITNLQTIGFRPQQQFLTDQLFLQRQNTFVDATTQSGFNPGQTAAVSAVGGDFDNDMDVDIYVVSSGLAGNRNNILYENQGRGRFIAREIPGALGSPKGLGDSVTTVDYNEDGALDLFITNGNFSQGAGLVSREFFNDGPHELLMNQGNQNHWLEIDLVGTRSNRDGIGSKVLVTAGGITQLREQSNGVHNVAQNHQRIHVGLGANQIVSRLEIIWTNGIRQRFTNIRADQILTVREGTGSNVQDLLQGTTQAEILQGLGGNDRLIGNGGSDQLIGGEGTDELIGGDGQDVLAGGKGVDIIQTGSGQDVIQFTSLQGAGDQITDFNPEQDRIEFGKGFGDGIGRAIADQRQTMGLQLGTNATGSDRLFYQQTTGNLFLDRDGSGPQSPILLATFMNTPSLSQQNFDFS
jgi:Ca2+-binding RTX toxin-like protein